MDHAEQRPDRELSADLEPRVELLPSPPVHPDLAALATFPSPDEDRAARSIEVALVQGERFADSQAGTPEQNDQRSKSVAVGSVTDRAHDRDDAGLTVAGQEFLDTKPPTSSQLVARPRAPSLGAWVLSSSQ